MTALGHALPARIERVERRALAVGLAGAGLLAAGLFLDPDQFFRSYLFGYLFWIGLTLGCLTILMLQHLTGGGWGLVIRRLLEAGTRTLPLLVALFLPIVLGMRRIYLWADPARVAGDHILEHKAPYLNLPFFCARAAAYFAIWLVLRHFLNKWSLDQDRTADPKLSGRLEALSAPGLVLLGLTVTFASIDWAMSLDPHWYSSIYGILFLGGHGLSCFAFVIIVVSLLAGEEPLASAVAKDHVHDLGKLMLAFVSLWAYFSLSQFLITWMGNLPEDIPWYIHRLGHGWQVVALALVLFHFALPFVLLLSRSLKRDARRLALVAGVVLVARLVDLFWLVGPELHAKEGLSLHWLDLAAPIGIGGLWLWAFARTLRTRPLLPIHDPLLPEVLDHGHHH